MAEFISMYRDEPMDIVVYHNKNDRPAINIPHLHRQYEFYYNISGADSFFVNNKFYKCDGHDLFVIPKGYVHKVMVKENIPYERCIVSIGIDVIRSINTAPYITDSLNWINSVGKALPGKIVFKTEKEHEDFIGFIDEYQKATTNLLRYSVITKILDFIGTRFKHGYDIKPIPPRNIVEKALVLIEEDFRNIKTAEISKKLYLNENYLAKAFKDKCGITLSNYLILRKLAEAKKYLYMGISVKDACLMSGFKNYSNFIRTFKKFEGVSPGNLEDLSDPL